MKTILRTVSEFPMKRIIKISMDVHSTSCTLCAIEPNICCEDPSLGECKIGVSAKNVLGFIERLKNRLPGDTDIE